MKNIARKKVMRNVYAIYLWRQITGVFGMKIVALGACFAVISANVSIKHVMTNMPAFWNVKEMFSFTTHAFINTELAVQIFCTAFLVVLTVLFIDVYRNIHKSPFIHVK
jgi:hypothetical protein